MKRPVWEPPDIDVVGLYAPIYVADIVAGEDGIRLSKVRWDFMEETQKAIPDSKLSLKTALPSRLACGGGKQQYLSIEHKHQFNHDARERCQGRVSAGGFPRH